MSSPKRGLGRGLAEVLGSTASADGQPREVPIRDLEPGPWQPRRLGNEAALKDLAQTVGQRGVLQPILVQQAAGKLRIIAGERRWRAAKLAGLKTVPAVVRDMSDRDAMFAAMVENIQREDLHPLDQASAAKRIVGQLKLPIAAVARELGMSRPALSNMLRLLELAPQAKKLLEENRIAAGHARAIASLPAARQEAAAAKIANEGMSVRQAEDLAERMRGGSGKKPARTRKSAAADADTARLCDELSDALGMRVDIRAGNRGSGKLTISYRSLDSLDSLIAKIRRLGRRS